MAYLNQWQKAFDHRLAQLEIKAFGKPRGPDGTEASMARQAAIERAQAQSENAPAPYDQPRAGVNRAARIVKP